jgi:glutaminyl-peptide cyclotransferase
MALPPPKKPGNDQLTEPLLFPIMCSMPQKYLLRTIAVLLATGLLLGGSTFLLIAGQDEPTIYRARVIASYPHDPRAFTQGLLFHDGFLWESTGHYGQSTLRKVDLASGEVLALRALPAQVFGEGLALWGDELVQLTWTNRLGFVYALEDLRPLRVFRLTGEGWGLTHDKKQLILSDGSADLIFLDPQDYTEVRRLPVHDRGQPVTRLNELEYIKGQVWANVWMTDRIAIISPRDGRVTAWLDLKGLLPAAERSATTAELNGIAYDAQNDRIFVTGKYWPKIFEIALEPAP